MRYDLLFPPSLGILYTWNICITLSYAKIWFFFRVSDPPMHCNYAHLSSLCTTRSTHLSYLCYYFLFHISSPCSLFPCLACSSHLSFSPSSILSFLISSVFFIQLSIKVASSNSCFKSICYESLAPWLFLVF